MRALLALRRAYSQPAHAPRRGHADFYASLLPAMIPVALLGSAVYMGLHLAQTRLAHEKFLDDAQERIRVLEAQVDSLHKQRPSVPASPQAPSSGGRSWWPWT